MHGCTYANWSPGKGDKEKSLRAQHELDFWQILNRMGVNCRRLDSETRVETVFLLLGCISPCIPFPEAGAPPDLQGLRNKVFFFSFSGPCQYREMLTTGICERIWLALSLVEGWGVVTAQWVPW